MKFFLSRNLSLDLFFFKTYEPPLYEVFMPREVSLLLSCTSTLRLRFGQFNKAKVPELGPNQIVIGQFASHALFDVNVYVHRNGHFHLPPTFSCYGIQITAR